MDIYRFEPNIPKVNRIYSLVNMERRNRYSVYEMIPKNKNADIECNKTL